MSFNKVWVKNLLLALTSSICGGFIAVSIHHFSNRFEAGGSQNNLPNNNLIVSSSKLSETSSTNDQLVPPPKAELYVDEFLFDLINNEIRQRKVVSYQTREQFVLDQLRVIELLNQQSLPEGSRKEIYGFCVKEAGHLHTYNQIRLDILRELSELWKTEGYPEFTEGTHYAEKRAMFEAKFEELVSSSSWPRIGVELSKRQISSSHLSESEFLTFLGDGLSVEAKAYVELRIDKLVFAKQNHARQDQMIDTFYGLKKQLDPSIEDQYKILRLLDEDPQISVEDIIKYVKD